MGIDCLILGDLTDQTRNDDSINEIVVERMDPSFNNEWVVKSFSECSLLFLLQVEKGCSFTLPHVCRHRSQQKLVSKNSTAGHLPDVDTPRLLRQHWTGAGLDRLNC